MYLKNSKIIVIKIGSSLLVDSNKKIRKKWLSSFAKDIQKLKDKNQKIVIVSSGAIALGCKKMGINKKTIKLDKSQAIASIGQIELMNLFSQIFSKYKLNNFVLFEVSHSSSLCYVEYVNQLVVLSNPYIALI